jgi:hypothetical protein
MEARIQFAGFLLKGNPCVDDRFREIFVLDSLRKNDIVVEWCCICKKCGDSIDHLLLHCEVVTKLWSVLFQLFGVAWVMPQRVSKFLRNWRGDNWETVML